MGLFGKKKKNIKAEEKPQDKKTYIGVKEDGDSVSLTDNVIHVVSDSNEYDFELSCVERMAMITNNLGPFYDDMALAVEVGNNTVIMIMSGHNSFKPFLFDQIGKVLPVDFNKIIEASTCTENGIFELYSK